MAKKARPAKRKKAVRKAAQRSPSARGTRSGRATANLDKLWAKFEKTGSLREYLVYDKAVRAARAKGLLPKTN